MTPGDLYVDREGGIWLVCKRPRWAEAPLMAANVHTGDLVLFERENVARRIRLSLERYLAQYAKSRKAVR